MPKQAFIVRCNPSKAGQLTALPADAQVFLGWSKTKNKLQNPSLGREGFKDILREAYPYYQRSSRALGQTTGYLWRFIREMKPGDYVLVPISRGFYLGTVEGEVVFHPDKVSEDAALRRDVKWKNKGKPIPRDFCQEGLKARLKYQGTCASATDLMDQIEGALQACKDGKDIDFTQQLRDRLVGELQSLFASKDSYLDPDEFEKLVAKLMLALGANETQIPAKNRYPGSQADADVIADFTHLGIRIYVQVKRHQGESDETAVEQVREAIDLNNQDGEMPIYGWAVTTGTFNEQAVALAQKGGIRLINGDELAEMMVDVGLGGL